MKTMKLGKTGIDISRIGLGTWSIGGGSAWGGDHELQTVVDTIREAPKAGVNLIDTAPGYNFGNSEKILGKALEKMNLRRSCDHYEMRSYMGSGDERRPV